MSFKGKHHTKESKDRMSRKGNLNPFFGKKHTEESKNKVSLKNKGKHLSVNTEFKKGFIPWNKGKKGAYSKEYRSLISSARIGRHNSPLTEFKKGRKISEEERQQMRERWKKNWANPEWASQWVRRQGRKPNNDELYFDAILQLNFPHEWRYVGDGKFWIEGRNPDFVNITGRKILIEYNGFWTHWKLDPEKKKDKEKTEHYAKYGWVTINLYREHLNEENIISEIKKFNKI